VNSILGEYLSATYFAEYQVLRNELMEVLSDADLGRRLGGGSASLGSLCREIGEIERGYVESFRTFRLDFRYRNDDPRIEGSVAALTAWYAELDRDLMAALEGLSEADVANRRIVRDDFDVADFSPLPTTQLDVYREALLIFYGKASVYLRALGKELPGHWPAWIG
jgi:DinB family protein